MIGIYLCDDEEAVRHQIQTALEWKIFVENYDMKVVCSASNAQELLDKVENGKRGIYFLDVELIVADRIYIYPARLPRCYCSGFVLLVICAVGMFMEIAAV